jgi:peptidoglycan/LPS O-acetylase OafA/YrhL
MVRPMIEVREYRPELDGVRGIAILLVLGAHLGVPGFAADGGLAGVTLFFVLSGYLITSILARELTTTGRIQLVRFYARRTLRLLPCLIAVLAAAAILYALGAYGQPPATLPLTFIAVLFYVANWAGLGGLELGTLAHTWSLAVEEQFYLVWPLALALGLRSRRAFGFALLIVAVLVTPYRFLIPNEAHLLVGTDTHLDALFLGGAIALLGARLPGWAGWLGLVGVAVLGSTWMANGLQWYLPLGAVASVAILAAAPKRLAWAPLAYLGRISYGLYLWHYLFIWWGLPWPVVFGLSLAVAYGSYRCIELPFLRLKSKAGRPDEAGPDHAIDIGRALPLDRDVEVRERVVQSTQT